MVLAAGATGLLLSGASASVQSASPGPSDPRAEVGPTEATDQHFDAMVDIGERSLYLACDGQGDLAIILLNGAGNDTTSWNGIIAELRANTRVCVYDRANTGASDPAPTPMSLGDSVGDLMALMLAAEIEPPVVLVGHSMGGLVALMAAATHPDAVAGIVLVDAPPADFFPDVACARLTPTACELLGQLMGPNGEGLRPSSEDLGTIRADLPDVPVRVLIATHHDVSEPGGDELEALATDMQAELAASLSDGELVVAEGSGHYIQDDRPELVIEVVAEILEAAGVR